MGIKMKVAIEPIEGHYGGAAQHILNIIRYSDHNFETIEVPNSLKTWGRFFRRYILPFQRRLPHEIEHNAMRFDMYGLQKLLDAQGFYLSRFKLPGFDVVHLHGYPYWETIYETNSPNLIYTIHNLYNKGDFPSNWSRTVESLTLKLVGTCRRANTVISVSKWLQKDLKLKHRIDSVYIPNGVSLEEFEEANGESFRKKYSIYEDFYLFVGRSTKYKRPELFISIAERMPKRKFVMVGRGLSKEALRKYIKKEIPSNLVCIEEPLREDVVNAFNACRVFILSSSNETFGIVLLEAMAQGKSVVAANNLGPSEIIDHGTTGLLFEPDNLESLVEAADLAWNEGDFGQAAKEKVVAKYDWRKIVPQIEEVYERVK